MMATTKSEEFLAKELRAARDVLWALSTRRRVPITAGYQGLVLDGDDLQIISDACNKANNALASWEEARDA